MNPDLIEYERHLRMQQQQFHPSNHIQKEQYQMQIQTMMKKQQQQQLQQQLQQQQQMPPPPSSMMHPSSLPPSASASSSSHPPHSPLYHHTHSPSCTVGCHQFIGPLAPIAQTTTHEPLHHQQAAIQQNIHIKQQQYQQQLQQQQHQPQLQPSFSPSSSSPPSLPPVSMRPDYPSFIVIQSHPRFASITVKSDSFEPLRSWFPWIEWDGSWLESWPMESTFRIPTSMLEPTVQRLMRRGFQPQQSRLAARM